MNQIYSKSSSTFSSIWFTFQTRGLILTLFSILLVGCSASPPPAPKKQAVSTWKKYLKAGPVIQAKQTQFEYELWTSLANPPPKDQLEDDLATAGLLVDVQMAEREYTLLQGPNECVALWPSQRAPVSKHRHALCADSLNTNQKDKLKAASYRITFTCKGEGLGSLLDAHNLGYAFSKKAKGIMVFPQLKLCKEPKKKEHFKTEGYIHIHSTPHATGLVMWTQGMDIFGMKNLVLTQVDPDRKQEGKTQLLAFADSMLRVDGQIEGGEIQSGPTSVGLLAFNTFSQHQKWINAVRNLAQFKDMLVCVPPKGKVNDQNAISILSNQLTLP